MANKKTLLSRYPEEYAQTCNRNRLHCFPHAIDIGHGILLTGELAVNVQGATAILATRGKIVGGINLSTKASTVAASDAEIYFQPPGVMTSDLIRRSRSRSGPDWRMHGATRCSERPMK